MIDQIIHKKPGEIITFFSYKGGTGRSMALANVAYLLGQNHLEENQRLLMIDWDLEAPGLHRYFPNKMKGKRASQNPGLIEYFTELKNNLQENEILCTDLKSEDGWQSLDNAIPLSKYVVADVAENIDLLKAGRLDEEYPTKVVEFDWVDFFLSCGYAIRAFQELLANKYSYILIDSRTGFTDTSGICTMILPERLVLVFTPNRQSLTGVIQLVERAIDYRLSSDDLRPLSIFPLPSRIDDAEELLRQKWRIDYQEEFQDAFQNHYNLDNCDLSVYFDEIKLPYKSFYSYGEELAVDKERDEAQSLHRAYRVFTNHLATLNTAWSLGLEEEFDAQSLWQQGIKLLEEQKYVEAVEVLKNGLSTLTTEEDNPWLEANILTTLGESQLPLGNISEAVEKLENASIIFRKIENNRGLRQTQMLLATAYQQLGRLDRASETAQALLTQIERDDETQLEDEAQAHNLLGGIYQQQGRLEQARRSFERIIQLNEVSDQPIDTHPAKTALLQVLSQLGENSFNQGNAIEAQEIAHIMLGIAQEIRDKDWEASILSNLGNTYTQLGEPHRAIDYLQKALDISREIGDSRGEGSFLGDLGAAYGNLGETHKAIDYFQQALETSREAGNRWDEGYQLGNLGIAYRKLGEPHKSIDYIQQALEINREISNRREEGYNLDNLGDAYRELGEYGHAKEYLNKAIEIAREISAKSLEAWAWCDLGNSFRVSGEMQAAEEHLTKALSLFREMDEADGIATASWYLGLLRQSQGDLAAAEELMQVRVDHYQKIGHAKTEEYAAQLEEVKSQLKES